MRTRVPKTRRTWLLIALCVVVSLVITMLEASGRPPRRAPAPQTAREPQTVQEPQTAPTAPDEAYEVEVELTE